jgi:RNA polymerase sigma-70 factor (ECF subfamily)
VGIGSPRSSPGPPGALIAHALALPTSDGELVDRALAGDHRAFSDLVRRYDDRLRGLAFKILGDRHRMDDAMQEAYLRAYRNLHRFRRDAELGSWLYRIVHNACIDELRRLGRRPPPVDTTEAGWDGPSTAPDPERTVVASDRALRALAALPEDQRATVLLVDGEGFDNLTAAAILEVAPGTVASRLSRARAAMRRELEGDER